MNLKQSRYRNQNAKNKLSVLVKETDWPIASKPNSLKTVVYLIDPKMKRSHIPWANKHQAREDVRMSTFTRSRSSSPPIETSLNCKAETLQSIIYLFVVVVIIIIYLVTSLYEGIQPFQLFPVLTHNSTDNISNGHHPYHTGLIDNWNVPDSIIWQVIHGKAREQSLITEIY